MEERVEDIHVFGISDRGGSLAERGYQVHPMSEWRLPAHVAKHLPSLAQGWDDMPRDPYMPDGGSYRERRYGSFTYDAVTGGLTPFKRAFFYQAKEINGFAGGIERRLPPLTAATVDNRLLHYLIESGVEHFTRTFGVAETLWDIGVHQFRILARDGRLGLPTPEGVHTDGHDFLSIHLIARDNVEGGVSSVYAKDGTKLATATLERPLDSMFVQDSAVLHGVTPVIQADRGREGRRDILVIDYNVVSS